jgi:hypothetical protein
MNTGHIAAGIKPARELLETCNLFYAKNTRKLFSLSPDKFDVEFKKHSMGEDYLATYKYAINNAQYDFLLVDQAFFQFSCIDDSGRNLIKVRYAYFPAPLRVQSYVDFLKNLGFDYDECGEEFYFDYEQALSEAKIKTAVIPIRYDFDIEQYVEMKHPMSHIHVGHESDVRIPCSCVISPVAFVGFVLRHSYWKTWKLAMDDVSFYEKYCRLKLECAALDHQGFSRKERVDFFIS